MFSAVLPRGGACQRPCTSDQVGDGSGSSTFPALQEVLKKAKAQAQVRPVEDRISSTKVFIERAKKRVNACRAEVLHAQEVLAKAQTQLQSEEQGLSEGEARLAAFLQEADGMRVEEPQPTAPVDFAHELAELRACVQDLQRGNQYL